MIARVRGVDAQQFHDEIVGGGLPVVLEAIAANWPLVECGQRSIPELATALKALDTGHPVGVFAAPPDLAGRFFYNGTLDGINFERGEAGLPTLIDQLLALVDAVEAPALYAGAVPLDRQMPDFGLEHSFAGFVPPNTGRIWIGNAVQVQTHFDTTDNLACVVAGTRRFTLFAPDQISNLYPGPIEYTLAGQPVSMALFDSPDLARYPRFVEALAAAEVADLGPGDALYIPALWWHHVRSSGPFNVLVNYWWGTLPPQAGAPMEALAHALLTIRHLPPAQRAAWRDYFEHYVFGPNETANAHLPVAARGVLGEFGPQLVTRIKSFLLAALNHRS
jgi:Cupin-like domain